MNQIREEYSPKRAMLIQQSIQGQLNSGLPIEYEILIDQIVAVPRTNDISQFDNYEDFVDRSSKQFRVHVYNPQRDSRPILEYNYKMSRYLNGSEDEIEARVKRQVSELMTQRDLDETKRLLGISQARVLELEVQLKELIKPAEALNGTEVKTEVNKQIAEWKAEQSLEKLKSDYQQALEEIADLERQLEEANELAQTNINSLGQAGGKLIEALPLYKKIEAMVTGATSQPVNGPSEDTGIEMTFREKPAESPAEEGFRLAFNAAIKRFDAVQMNKFNDIFQACLDDPALVGQLEAHIRQSKNQ